MCEVPNRAVREVDDNKTHYLMNERLSMSDDSSADQPAASFTRRGFLQSAAAAAATTHLPPAVATERGTQAAPVPSAPARQVTLDINGKSRQLTLEPRVTLLDALR